MRRNILVTPLVAVLAIGASGIYASAQDTTSAVLMGTVTGSDGKPMSGVRVYLTSPALLTPRDGRTDAQGKFNFRLLPPGRYTVTYSADGFISRKAEMALLAGVAANGDIRLRAMDVQGAAVEIVAEVSNVITPDKTDTSVQTVFTTDRLEEIGGGRGVAALQSLTPGLYGTIYAGETSSTVFSIRGGLGRGNKVIQDGQVVNDAMRGTYFNAGDTIEDLIESIAVIQSPLNAKLGNTDGGIISITTKRGGNMFSGSLRYGGTRGMTDQGTNNNAWKTTSAPYPDARGYVGGISGPPNDTFSKNWQYSLTGPIIPNYLTFAIGGNLRPTIDERRPWKDNSGFGIDTWSNSRWSDPAFRYSRNMGTFYLDNDPLSDGYGDVIRKSYWGDAYSPDEWMYFQSSGGTNTFNLYLQVTPNHQFTWYYNQNYFFSAGNGKLMESPPDDVTKQSTISWNVSYKAVLGAAGVLDARFGKSSSFSYSPRRGKETVKIKMYRSYITADSRTDDWYRGSWDQVANLNPGTYNATPGTPGYRTGTGWVSSGMIDDFWNGFNQSFRGASTYDSISEDAGGDNGSDIISANANYQHMLEFKGQHIIDIGWNMNQVDAPASPNGARIVAAPVGQIAADAQLNKYHIGNILPQYNGGSYAGGYGRLGPEYYAGKYIVFDVVRPNGQGTLISMLEPHALIRPTILSSGANGGMLQDGFVWNPGTLNGGVWQRGQMHSQLSGMASYLPYMKERLGNDGGEMRTTTSSVYVNDMWTIDDHHSVMLGLRADIFSLKDSVRTVHSYTKITPRLEYKFDLKGDQRHLFAASLAQFHQMAAVNVYWPFIEGRWANTSWRYWTGAALSDPNLRKTGYYLVGYDDLMNPANYTEEYDSLLSGKLFGDVDKNFRPPTSTEFSAWYRHTFPSGGSFKVSFNNRTWSDLYSMFPSSVFAWNNPRGGVENKIKAVLKNTSDYTRTYNGVELLWDFPITRKVSFGGNYTYSRFLHNQTGIGSGTKEDYIGEGGYSATATTGSTAIILETPGWFDTMFSKDVVDADGNFLYNFGGHNAWAPMQRQYNEFSLGYYLIVNLTQGKARSNFTLRGNYRGGETRYDSVFIRTGKEILPEGPDGIRYNQYSGQGDQLDSGKSVYFGQSTTNDSFSNDFSYNLNMPIAKRLSWFLNVSVSNFFNHQPRTSSVPTGAGSGSTITPWPYQTGVGNYNWTHLAWNDRFHPDNLDTGRYPNVWNAAPMNPFIDGWNWTPGANGVGGSGSNRYFYKQYGVIRAISMSTGIRF